MKYFLLTFFFANLTIYLLAQPFCESFDATTVSNGNKADAFNIYGNGNSGFLSDWFVASGTPSIYATGDFAGVNAYDGNQYALAGVCDVSNTWADGLLLQYNFAQNQSYDISSVIRNAPSGSVLPTPIDVDYVLLQNIIPYTYNPNTGCSSTPAIPSSAFVVHTVNNFTQNSWQIMSFNTGNLTANYSYIWIRPKFSMGSPLVTTLLLIDSFCIAQNLQSNCESFEDTQISQADKEQAFNIYGNGNTGFLQNWFVCSGTPSIYASGWLPGVNAYQGNQYALQVICDVGPLQSEDLMLQYNFMSGKSYDISFAVRNAPSPSNVQPTPIDVDYILLPTVIPYNYNSNTGCSPTPAVPANSFTTHTLTNFAQNSWQVVSFNTGVLTSTYSYLWIRPQFSFGAPLVTTVFCTDSFCITPSLCSVTVNLGNDTSICANQIINLNALNTSATYQWNTGSTNQTVSINAAGVYWVDVSFGGCTERDSIVVVANPSPVVNLGNDTSLCIGQTILFDATNINSTYNWQDNSTNATLAVSVPGNYSVTVINASNCSVSDAVNVTYTSQPPVVALGKDTDFCGNEGLLLKPATGNVQYHWQDNSTDSIYLVTSSGTYSVTVSNGCGTATDKIKVDVHADNCALLLPTAFSPNNDGVNDVFRPISRCGTKQYQMRIYNRWGELVFESNDVSEGWNGNFKSVSQPMGVFAYYYEYFNYCENKLKKIAGNVSLIR